MRNNPQLQHDDLPIWLALKYKFERLHVATTPCRPFFVRPRDQDDPYDDAHPEGENSAESKPGPSMSGNQEQLDDFDFWTNSFATYNDEIPNKKVSQELVDEMSHIVDEGKLHKVVDEMLRQRRTLRDEHQYYIDQMQNFLKNDIVWESRKEILVSQHPQRPTPVVQSCQRDPKAPALSLVNQDLLYLKKGSSGPENIMMSLDKFPAIIFPDDDIEERTSRWVNKCVKKFNPYARYNVEHWKNPHAKIFYIKKQKELGKPKEIVARRVNGSIVSIIESDYKNLNKNDIKDMYLLIVNHKVDDYVEAEPVYGIIYKNNKKEKRVMRHQEVHKFCDATLKRVLEGLKSYNNDVKHGYVTQSLNNEDAKYLQLFEEEIKEWLKHRDQIRRWEMYVNGIPLGSRRERPE
ncbi:hypothetical protein Tco_0438114 [Tanacetum coccineum]